MNHNTHRLLLTTATLLGLSLCCPFEEYSNANQGINTRQKRMVNFAELNCIDGWTPCDETFPYRSIDGRCNNLHHQTWGSALLPYIRFVPPEYDDGIGSPRQHSVTGKCLPSARKISKTIHMPSSNHKMKLSSETTHMLMLWGQFLDHDITHTPQKDSRTSCCSYEGFWRNSTVARCHPKSKVNEVARRLRNIVRTRSSGDNQVDKYSEDTCMGIELEEDDNTFGEDHECINFQRSIAVPEGICHPGHREQLNQATAFIDGSQVYGSEVNLAWELRQQEDGLMKVNNKHLLPVEDRFINSVYSECVRKETSELCFKAGDNRVNIQPGLASIHTLFVMEHNRIAKLLKSQLDASTFSTSYLSEDEYLYQETRNIVGAMLQHITVNEFLPILLGVEGVKKYGLNPDASGSRTGYDPETKPIIRNEFATFAFRVGHTLIPEGVLPMTSTYEPHGTMSHFVNIFQNPHMVYEHGIGQLLRGIITKPSKESTANVVHDLEKAFTHSNKTVGGMDLVAFNIQRGRDHGIPSYTKLRELCKLSVPTTFDDLDMPHDVKRKLSELYDSVEDIDAWTAAVSENKVSGAVVGPLNHCIIGRQFRALKKGDRHWYGFQHEHVGFGQGQLNELYKTSLAKVLCENLDMDTIQSNVFYMASESSKNSRKNCDSIEGPDFSNWYRK